MKMFVEPDDIYLHTQAVDFRKSINGLLNIVESELELDAFSGAYSRYHGDLLKTKWDNETITVQFDKPYVQAIK